MAHLTPYDVKTMNRLDLTKRLTALLANEAVIAGIGNTNNDLWAAGRRPQNYYMKGSMGLSIPIALGVAIAQPQRHVFALEGDGSLLMQLGCLATVATLAPKNLTMIVWDNGAYLVTGAQASATSQADIAAIARASGIGNSVWAKDEADFEALVKKSLGAGGSNLIAARIDKQPATGKSSGDMAAIARDFMRGMGAPA